jgi:hypothetical protein
MKYWITLVVSVCFLQKTYAQEQSARQIKKEWVSALRDIYKKTHAPYVREMLTLAKKMKVVSSEHAPVWKKTSAVHFVPITLRDTMTPYCKEYVLNTAMPAWQLGGCVFFKYGGDSSSSLYKGLALFHELQHTLAPLALTATDHAKEERRVYSIQNEILSVLGGKAYDIFLEHEIAYVTFYMNYVGKEDLSNLPRHLSERPKLDAVFGKPCSVAERYTRESTVWIHVIMKYLSRTMNSEDAERAQVAFLQNLYRKDIYTNTTPTQ